MTIPQSVAAVFLSLQGLLVAAVEKGPSASGMLEISVWRSGQKTNSGKLRTSENWIIIDIFSVQLQLTHEILQLGSMMLE